MKKYIIGAVLALGMLVSPVFASAEGLTSTQIQSILSLLSAFGVDSATIANVQTALNGGTPTAVTAVGNAVGTSFCYNFNSDLAVGGEGIDGSSGTDVKALVTVLLNEGALKGSLKDVEAGVVKFQTKYDIRQTGYVGPLTRGKLNSLYGCSIQSATPSITLTSPNGGDQWQAGTTHTITWIQAGNIIDPHASVAIGLFNLKLPSIEDPYAGQGNSTTLSSPPTYYESHLKEVSVHTGTNTYAWAIPSNLIPDANYQISIGGQGLHINSNTFTIR